jgi:hypothetical protein
MKFKGVQWEGHWYGTNGLTVHPDRLESLSYLVWGEIPSNGIGSTVEIKNRIRKQGFTLWPYLRDFPNHNYRPMMYR